MRANDAAGSPANFKFIALVLVMTLLAVQSAKGDAILLTDYRNLKNVAQSPDQDSRDTFPGFLGVLSPPLYVGFNHASSVDSDSQGGPGSASAHSTASQVSTLSPHLFEGSLAVDTGARATESTVEWGYYGRATAESLFGVQFQLLSEHDYEVTGSGVGNTSTSLKQIGGIDLFSQSGFETLGLSGHLLPGTYEFRFVVNADAVAWYSSTGSIDSESGSANFRFTLTDGIVDVPEGGSSLLMLGFGSLMLCLANSARRNHATGQ